MSRLSTNILQFYKKYARQIFAFGLVYHVLWSVAIYFGWEDSPQIITWLDLVSGAVLLYLAYGIHTGKYPLLPGNLPLKLLELASLAYASAWTVVIMGFMEVELADLLLPLDFISLLVTTTLFLKILKHEEIDLPKAESEEGRPSGSLTRTHDKQPPNPVDGSRHE